MAPSALILRGKLEAGSDAAGRVAPLRTVATGRAGKAAFRFRGDERGMCLAEGADDSLVANGGFESPVVDTAAGWDIYDSGISGLGWAVEWNNDTTSFGGQGRPDPAHLELHREVNGWGHDEGAQHAELDTDWDSPGGSLNDEPATVEISQDLDTPETFYKLSYAYSPRPGHSDNALNVFWDGSKIKSHTADGSGNADTDWTTVEVVVQASDDTTTLAFAEESTPDSLGMFLDDVSVVEIREESAWVCDDESAAQPFEGNNWATYFTYEPCASSLGCNGTSS